MSIEAKDKDLDKEASCHIYVPLAKEQNTGSKVVGKFEIKH